MEFDRVSQQDSRSLRPDSAAASPPPTSLLSLLSFCVAWLFGLDAFFAESSARVSVWMRE